MTESVSYSFLFIISTLLALFLFTTTLFLVIKNTARLYHLRSNADKRLIEACENDNLKTVQYYLEKDQHWFLGDVRWFANNKHKTILSESQPFSSKDTLETIYRKAFKAACSEGAHEVIQYLVNLPEVRQAVSRRDFTEFFLEELNHKDHEIISILQSHFVGEINAIHNPGNLLLRIIECGQPYLVKNQLLLSNPPVKIHAEHLAAACQIEDTEASESIFEMLIEPEKHNTKSKVELTLNPNMPTEDNRHLSIALQAVWDYGHLKIAQSLQDIAYRNRTAIFTLPIPSKILAFLEAPETCETMLSLLERRDFNGKYPRFNRFELTALMMDELLFRPEQRDLYQSILPRILNLTPSLDEPMTPDSSDRARYMKLLCDFRVAHLIAGNGEQAVPRLCQLIKQDWRIAERIIALAPQEITQHLHQLTPEACIRLACVPAFRNAILSQHQNLIEAFTDKLLNAKPLSNYRIHVLEQDEYLNELDALGLEPADGFYQRLQNFPPGEADKKYLINGFLSEIQAHRAQEDSEDAIDRMAAQSMA